ncbi:winged helix-turn-helix transcriptional regulator [Bacteroides faecium]|uniref:winged helix-turn-helix transcriptional regulator n=1 Tax=Bacteroides faecium TaxID=2715212 RepID=UPI001FD8210B|nr:winged helix-turn-helix transcriptional regulator [Bacteroides faecium]
MLYRGFGTGIIRALKEETHIEFINDEVGNQFTTIIRRDEISKEKSKGEVDESKVNDDKSKVQSREVRDKGKGQINKSKGEIIRLMSESPMITMPEIAQTLSLSLSGVEKAVRQLREAGIIKREGSTKAGRWMILSK